MSADTDPFCRAIAAYAARRLRRSTEFVGDLPWAAREAELDRGRIHVGWICGLPYTWKKDRDGAPLELLAAPVMQDKRYADQPIYFSDLVVHRRSDFRKFSDLRGTTWAYNEEASFSGYVIMQYHLVRQGESLAYFSRQVRAGTHHHALQMVIRRQADSAAIDCTALEMELQREPALGSSLLVLETLGPNPMPPWVISTLLPARLRRALRGLLLGMHQDPEGRAILADCRIRRFAAVGNRHYNPIRKIARLVSTIDQP